MFEVGIDIKAFWIVLLGIPIFFALYRRFGGSLSPAIKFSNVEPFQKSARGMRQLSSWLPRYMEYAVLVAFLIAFLDPYILLPKQTSGEKPSHSDPLEGLGIYLVLDQSGSMTESVDAYMPDGSRRVIPKIELLKDVTKTFVEERPSDMLGVIAFARGVHILSPLTLDHQTILDDLDKFSVDRTPDQEGTSLGYAVYKTASLIVATRHFAEDLQREGKPAYEIKNTIIILVTDGVQETNPLDKGKRFRTMELPEAAAYAKEQGVRLYLVNIDPQILSDELAPFRRQIEKATKLTGGKFFTLSGTTSLSDVYNEINTLEKSRLPGQQEYLDLLKKSVPKDKLPNLYDRISLYPYLISLGLLCLLCSHVLNTLVLRRIP